MKGECGPENLQASRARVQMGTHVLRILIFTIVHLAYKLLHETVSLLLP